MDLGRKKQGIIFCLLTNLIDLHAYKYITLSILIRKKGG